MIGYYPVSGTSLMFIITHLHDCSTYKREKGKTERQGTHAGSQSKEAPTQDLPQPARHSGEATWFLGQQSPYDCELHVCTCVHIHTDVCV